MANPQLYPLETNPRTGEPFLRLKHLKNIILTPPRQSDIACCITFLNDPRIYRWLSWPQIPLLPEDAEAWYASARAHSDTLLRELAEANAKGVSDLVTVDGCPVRIIREVQENREDVFVGDIDVFRCNDGRKLAISEAGRDVGEEEEKRYVERNMRCAVGDPKIVWYVRGYLKPSYHGQRIMSEALSTILWDWAVPRMDARRMLTTIFAENRPSIKVALMNAFSVKRMVEDYVELRGEIHDCVFCEWNIDVVPGVQSKL